MEALIIEEWNTGLRYFDETATRLEPPTREELLSLFKRRENKDMDTVTIENIAREINNLERDLKFWPLDSLEVEFSKDIDGPIGTKSKLYPSKEAGLFLGVCYNEWAKKRIAERVLDLQAELGKE